MNWVETTLRKCKKPKICKDIFITYSSKGYELVKVKNGTIATREKLRKFRAKEIIKEHGLKFLISTIFKNCYTYRTHKSNILVQNLIANQRARLLGRNSHRTF